MPKRKRSSTLDSSLQPINTKQNADEEEKEAKEIFEKLLSNETCKNPAAGLVQLSAYDDYPVLTISGADCPPKFYNRDGFYIGNITCPQERIQIDMLYDQLTMEGNKIGNNNLSSPVFNTMPVAQQQLLRKYQRANKWNGRVDEGRNMLLVSKLRANISEEKQIRQLSEYVGECIKESVKKDLHLDIPVETENSGMVLTLLETQPPVTIHKRTKDNGMQTIYGEVPNQILHSDVQYQHREINKPYMFIGLLALTEGTTKIRLTVGSHKCRKPTSFTIVELEKYQYFVGHPFLIHSGCGTSSYNIRLHFYHGLPPSVADETSYPVNTEDNLPLFDRNEHLARIRIRAAERRKSRTGRKGCALTGKRRKN